MSRFVKVYEKSEYLDLRFRVESEIGAFITDTDTGLALLKSIMRQVVQANADKQAKHNAVRRSFLTFRRNPDLKAPSWAFRKPGAPRVFTPNR